MNTYFLNNRWIQDQWCDVRGELRQFFPIEQVLTCTQEIFKLSKMVFSKMGKRL